MIAPDAAAIRARSKVDFGTLGYANDVSLQDVVDEAVEYVLWVTGHVLVDLPSYLEQTMGRAIRTATEWLAFRAQEDVAEAGQDFDLVGSFSAGQYSETRRSPTDAVKARLINPFPPLADALWNLLMPWPGDATPQAVLDRYEFWTLLLSGENAPAFDTIEVNWSGEPTETWVAQWPRWMGVS